MCGLRALRGYPTSQRYPTSHGHSVQRQRSTSGATNAELTWRSALITSRKSVASRG